MSNLRGQTSDRPIRAELQQLGAPDLSRNAGTPTAGAYRRRREEGRRPERHSSDDFTALKRNERAAWMVLEPNVENAEHLVGGDESSESSDED